MRKAPLFVLIAILIGLFFTNPKADQFEEYLIEEIETNTKSDKISEIFGKIFSEDIARLATKNAIIDDYYIFSTYKLKLPDLDIPNTILPDQELRYLGIFNRFIPLHTEKLNEIIQSDK